MGEKLVIGPVNKGIRTDRTPFVIDNDAFPTLTNAYQWRGRVKRKRGTQLLNRLQRYIGTTDGAGNLVVTILPITIATGIATFVIGSDTFVDPGTTADPGVQNLTTNSAGTGTLDRVNGTLTITGSQATTDVIYYPRLPVMGLRDFQSASSQFPGTVAFDTDYSYNISLNAPYNITDVSFYNNPSTGTYTGYTQKTTWTPISWNGADYQQFWTVNYQGAMWATNGIDVEFTGSNIGMQFKPISGIVINAGGPPASVTITIGAAHGLVIGDFVYINEVSGITEINFQTGYVTAIAATTITVILPNATVAGAWISGGIVQYLTSRSDVTKDCIRWYNGDPTDGLTPPTFQTGRGWVNFMPPLSENAYSIADLPPAIYYLVGGRVLFPFKDRLLVFGPVVQTSTGSPVYLQDTIIYSQNGTPYYTSSYTNTPSAAVDFPTSADNVFNPILVPTNQTATAPAWFEDQTGFGGFKSAGVSQPIITVGVNEDALMVGFSGFQTRLVYTGNDIVPFDLFITNSELGSGSTFSTINMDKGVMTRGNRGIIISNQTGTARIDLDIPDQVFQFALNDNGSERVCSQRDYISEWIYLSYPINKYSEEPDATINKFPSQTLLYNYRDNSWGIFNESYTTYGLFRPNTGLTWNTLLYQSWNEWNSPWNSGDFTVKQQEVIAGNQQGYVIFRRTNDTGEDNSLAIQNIVGATSTVTSPAHGLDSGDYIYITGVNGTVGTQVNDKIFSVSVQDIDNFIIVPDITTATYLGGGQILRMYIPQIQTKQFPVAWDLARKTRIGPQQYLLSKTTNAQISLLIFLSQDSADAYNDGPIVPDPNSVNESLVYSTILYTCPETTNLGLTAANSNLQMPISTASQAQIWHRMNTSLIGDTVQVGFTLSDTQMRTLDDDDNFVSQFAEIELHAIVLDVQPSQVLA